MENKNSIFIATSIDGYIADRNGDIEWLHSIPNPDHNDMGYGAFMSNIDALVMGRNTFETVCAFDIEWPYTKPVFVLSNKLKSIPGEFDGKVYLVNGDLHKILEYIRGQGYARLYIDGGSTIQSFLRDDLIDEMVITRIPILLGAGAPLFAEHSAELSFKLVDSKVYLNAIVQSHYARIKLGKT